MEILELFAGYGSQSLALKYLGIEHTSDISEIDQYAIKAYNQIHGNTHNWGDITKIDETKLPYYDLITYSSPCQDFSVAGLGKGGDKDSGTRSSLLWECERIIRAVKPKYLLMENVKNLVGEKHKHNFIKWLRVLESLGYQNYWQVLNAKDYGIPQNRERVFVVSIRKDLKQGYIFPEKQELTKRLKDVLESNVDEKYYLSDKIVNRFKMNNKLGTNIVGSTIGEECTRHGQMDYVYNPDKIMGALCSTDYKQPKQIIEPICAASRGRNPENPNDRTTGTPTVQRLEINYNGVSNTLTSVQKDNYVIEPLKIKDNTKKGYTEACEYDSINIEQPNSKTRRGRVGKQISNTLMCSCNMAVVEPVAYDEQNNYIRKDGCVGTITTDGSSPKHNNRIVEYITKDCRFYKQAYETAINNDCKIGDTIDAFNKKVSKNGVSPTLTTRPEGFKTAILPVQNYRIRKLTPRECWRLMGVKDEQFDKLHDISNTQLYKMAGNSIVVDVLMGIFKNLLITDKQTTGQLTLL